MWGCRQGPHFALSKQVEGLRVLETCLWWAEQDWTSVWDQEERNYEVRLQKMSSVPAVLKPPVAQ